MVSREIKHIYLYVCTFRLYFIYSSLKTKLYTFSMYVVPILTGENNQIIT